MTRSSSHTKLARFLASPSQPKGTLGFHQLQGFLFALVCTPKMIQPSQWIPKIFGGEEPEFRDGKEAQEIFGFMIELYNAGAKKGPKALLPIDKLCDDPLSNSDPQAPIAQWSQGFSYGYHWLEKIWDRYGDAAGGELQLAWVQELMYFAFPLANESTDSAEDAPSPTDLAGGVAEGLEETAHEFWSFWKDFYRDEILPDTTAGSPTGGAAGGHRGPSSMKQPTSAEGSLKIGRNDPCPCLSGKKFKRCCGRLTH